MTPDRDAQRANTILRAVLADFRESPDLASLAPSPKPETKQYPLSKAIEFAEYMAKHAGYLIDAINWLEKARIELNEDDAKLHLASQFESAQQAVSDRMRALESSIYEFRKRAEKAATPPAPTEQADREDAARYRWLTEDHAADARVRRNKILERMPVMSHSAASAAIDAARASQAQ